MGLPSIIPSLPTAGAGQVPKLSGLPALINTSLAGPILNMVYVKSNIGGYFFDAVFRTEHQSRLKITQHPVQGGANISDHAYMEPEVVTMEIGMSDANPTPIFQQFTSSANKSVSAFEALKLLQESRKPLDVSTRLKQYTNMLIESLVVPDDIKTATGLRASITLRRIIMVDVPKVQTSSRPQATNLSAGGSSTPTPVTPQTFARKGALATGLEK